MKIQSISIVVPTGGCVNNCPFCVSKMHKSPYEDQWDESQMIKRIQYAVMSGVNTCVITGTGEPLQNKSFLNNLVVLFRKMNHPFPNVEFQTTGVFLSEQTGVSLGTNYEFYTSTTYPNIEVLKYLRVNTISLSVANIFDDSKNNKIIGTSQKTEFYLYNLIQLLKANGFNIRLSLNMLKDYDNYTPEHIIARCKELNADQITFRKMYYNLDKDSFIENNEGKWAKENKCNEMMINDIKRYIQGGYESFVGGKLLYKLPFGAKVYSISGMSVVMDDDCMSEENDEALKYIILRENGKLYCRWNDEGSLIF